MLLDTHIFLWALAGSARLKPATRRLIESADLVCVSAASSGEIAIRANLGKIKADPHALSAAIATSGLTELPIRSAHAAGGARIAPRHDDPFDRRLIAQALAEALTLLMADALLVRYGDPVVLV